MTRPGATLEGLAETLYVDAEDIRTFVTSFVVIDGDEIPYDLIGDIHNEFNPHCERTVPGYYGATGDDI